MAYIKKDYGSGLDMQFDNSFVTKREFQVLLEQLKETSLYHQLEVFEVVELYDRGVVSGRYVISEQGLEVEKIINRTFLPLNPNIVQYPIRGELWWGLEYQDQHYYLAKLSKDLFDVNNVNHNESTVIRNTTTNLSTSGSTIPYTNINPTPATYQGGDTLIQGRFGNTITLGNSVSSGSIRIDNTNSLIELINISSTEDFAGIFMETDIYVFDARDTVNIQAQKDIVINAIEQDIIAFASNNVDISGSFLDVDTSNDININVSNDINIDTKNNINIDAKNNMKIKSSTQTEIDSSKINIGSNSLVPAVLGNADFIKAIDIILSMQISANTAQIAVEAAKQPPNVPKINELTQENIDLNRIKTGRTYLSKKVNVE